MSKLICHNGRVITMNDDELFAEAVLVEDGKIVAVGSNDEILAMKDDDTEVRDLEGNCLMPSFIHFSIPLSMAKNKSFEVGNVW